MAMDQAEYTARYNALAARYEKLQARHDGLQKKRERRQIQANEISGFLFAVYSLDTLPLDFDPALWSGGHGGDAKMYMIHFRALSGCVL